MSVSGRLIVIIPLASLIGGYALSQAHPVAPFLATSAFLAFLALFYWRPRSGFFLVPFLLPVLNFSPWTGWLMVDEFDLLVLAFVSAGYFRLVMDQSRTGVGTNFLALLACVVVLVAYGARDLNVQEIGGFAGYLSPLNSGRIGKSLLWGVLMWPLIVDASRRDASGQWVPGVFTACLLGSGWVVLSVFWERAFHPGLLEMSTPYRTSALFWEMHLGGAALDGYLVLIAPLLVWVWRRTLSIPCRLALGVFILAFIYACLTTFSRGVWGAIAGSMLVLLALFLLRRERHGKPAMAFRLTNLLLLSLVVLEIVLVLGADSFMNKRLAASERDLSGRWQHWERGLGLLETPLDYLFGIGLGQLPSRLVSTGSILAAPGEFAWKEEKGQGGSRHSMLLSGPTRPLNSVTPGGLYALSQRVELEHGANYRFAMQVRGMQRVDLLVQLCAMHLLYPEHCQHRRFRINPLGWQTLEAGFSGGPFKEASWLNAGHGVLLLSVITPGASVELGRLSLSVGHEELLRNTRFAENSTGWFAAAQSYFLPWHIDNLYLELLIETGVTGLAGFLALVFMVILRLFRAYARGNLLAPYFIASISGLMTLGLVVSVLDMPRVATLFFLLLLWGWLSRLGPAALDTDPVYRS